MITLEAYLFPRVICQPPPELHHSPTDLITERRLFPTAKEGFGSSLTIPSHPRETSSWVMSVGMCLPPTNCTARLDFGGSFNRACTSVGAAETGQKGRSGGTSLN
jgi:hypothetical protein